MRKGFTLIELMIVIAIIAIIAAIAIPNLLESRVTANEAAAGASLKSGFFPAEVQWQGGGYADTDADNVGEYAPIEYLAGLKITNTNLTAVGAIHLVTGALANAAAGSTMRTANGYNYVAVVPGAAGGATLLAEGTTLDVITSNDRERAFACAAGPEVINDTGRRIFVILNDGQVRSPTLAAARDAWLTGSPAKATAASLLAGFALAAPTTALLSTANDLSSTTNAGNYPVYTK